MNFIYYFKRVIISNMFFLLAFTFTIFTFSIGNSIVHNEKISAKKYVSGNLKNISFQSSYPLKLSELESIIKNYPLSFWVSYSDSDGGFLVSTELIKNTFSIIPSLSSGESFSKSQLKGNDHIAISSSATNIDGNFKITALNNEKIPYTSNGEFYGLVGEVFVPNESFYSLIGDDIITNKPLLIWLGGDEKIIDSCVEDLRSYLFNLDKSSSIDSFKSNSFVPSTSANVFSQASFKILLITLINSITLSSLWIEKRKKELSIRKTVGATEKLLSRIFFKELSIISIVSTIFSLLLYLLVINITGGFVLNLNLTPSIRSILTSIALTFGTSYIVSLYLVTKLKKMHTTELLGGE